eukprot:IDg16931t1
MSSAITNSALYHNVSVAAPYHLPFKVYKKPCRRTYIRASARAICTGACNLKTILPGCSNAEIGSASSIARAVRCARERKRNTATMRVHVVAGGAHIDNVKTELARFMSDSGSRRWSLMRSDVVETGRSGSADFAMPSWVKTSGRFSGGRHIEGRISHGDVGGRSAQRPVRRSFRASGRVREEMEWFVCSFRLQPVRLFHVTVSSHYRVQCALYSPAVYVRRMDVPVCM